MADIKMPTAQELPSGSWRCRVYDKELKKQVSFISKLPDKAGKAEAETMAREYILGKRQKREKGKTVGEYIDEYIDLKENILSPTTINEYRRMRKALLTDVCDIYLSELTQKDVQEMVNRLALTKQPKTVRNAHGLLVSTLNVYAPDMRLRTTLPKLQKKIKQLPDVKDVLKAIIGTDVELPCLLAIWSSLRMSEIRGIKKSDVNKNILTIQRARVRVRKEDILKNSTKTFDSTRIIRLPAYIRHLINQVPDDKEYLYERTGQTLYSRFEHLLKINGVTPHMSFHDLRHLDASIMLSLGVPDKYAMERGGWSSPHIMKSVYQHTFSAEREAVEDKIDNYFYDIIKSIENEKTNRDEINR